MRSVFLESKNSRVNVGTDLHSLLILEESCARAHTHTHTHMNRDNNPVGIRVSGAHTHVLNEEREGAESYARSTFTSLRKNCWNVQSKDEHKTSNSTFFPLRM